MYAHIIVVAEVQASNDLVNVTFGHFPAQATPEALQLVQQSVIQVLEDQVEPFPPAKHFDHVHQIVVV